MIRTNTDEEMLTDLQRETFDYFLFETDSDTGLVIDKTQAGTPSSIAVVGMAISSYLIGVEKQFLSRRDAKERILKVLRFFSNSHQGPERDATGYKGFYYHFLDMRTGKRAWNSGLSTIDTTFFIAGVLSAGMYFSLNDDDENEIREIADKLYRRIDWQWALNDGSTISHGWNPEAGFSRYRWDRDYHEGMLMYMLAMGSPSYPIGPEGYEKWTSTFQLKKVYGYEYLYAGPLFIHQFSHLWIDFKNISDNFNRKVGFDYFDNSKRATLIHRQYAIENPNSFSHYGEYCWGLTASDGPGECVMKIDGKQRQFYGYYARGAPEGPDDGTVSPWAVVASLPFLPDLVLETVRHAIGKLDLKSHRLYGFDASFNPTFPEKNANPNGWVSSWKFGLNQGSVVIMIENYQSGLIWNLMKTCSYLSNGLRLAKFEGGWLDAVSPSKI